MGKFCMVGSGRYPETLLILNSHFKNLIGIDYNPKAIQSASQYITGLPLSNSINFIESPAEEYDFSNEEVILIAFMTLHKQEVLNRIAETASKGTFILLRHSTSFSTLFTDVVKLSNLPDKFIVLDKISRISFDQGEETVLLKIKG
jgi:hypothetical protein